MLGGVRTGRAGQVLRSLVDGLPPGETNSFFILQEKEKTGGLKIL